MKDDQTGEKFGSVKVKFPWMRGDQGKEIESNWMRLVAPGAGASRGMMFMPEVNDEVAVLFDRGSPERGFVLGGLWNGKDATPVTMANLIEGQAIKVREIRYVRYVEMRYRRQEYTVKFALPDTHRTIRTTEALREAFLDAYKRRYGHASKDLDIELVMARMVVAGRTDQPELFLLDQTLPMRLGDDVRDLLGRERARHLILGLDPEPPDDEPVAPHLDAPRPSPRAPRPAGSSAGRGTGRTR